MVRPKLDYQYAALNDPRREPTWRYDRARRLVSEKRPPHPHRDDAFIRKLRDFFVAKDRVTRVCSSDYDSNVILGAKYRDFWLADRIFCNGRADKTRFSVEAMILSGRNNQQIADRASITPEAVEIYEQLFFNVRDRLQAKSYISSQVLGPAFMAGLANRSPELTAKYFGYFGGPLVLDLVLDAFDGSIAAPTEPRELSGWLDHQFRLRLRSQNVIGITFLEPTNYNIRTLLEAYQGIMSLQHREDAVGGDDNLVNKAVEVFLKVNAPPVGAEADKLLATRSKPYSGLEVVPRVAHMRDIAAGKPVQILDAISDSTWVSPKIRQGEDDAATDQRSDNQPLS